jgi:HK97 family phage major capsid protein
MSDELNELQSITHQYRKSLDAYEARTGRAPQTVDTRGSGEEREKFARMDDDLTAIELRAQEAAELKSLRERLSKLESEPTLKSRANIGNPAKGDARSSEKYARAWLNYVATGNDAELRAATDIALTTTNAGVPTDMERRIIEKMQQAGVIRSLARVSSIDSKRTITVEGALPATNLIGEASGVTQDEITFDTAISVVPYKYATRLTISQEFIEDAIGSGGIGTGLAYCADKCGMSIALKQEEAFTIGTGSSQPEGCMGSSMQSKLSGLSQVVDLGTTAFTNITADNIIDTYHLVPPEYRFGPRFSWVMHDQLLKHVRKLKTSYGTVGTPTNTYTPATEYIWTPGTDAANSMVGGMPGTLYGVPYRVAKYARTATANNNVFMLIGNFEYFEIFDRTGITSIVDPYSESATHQVNLIVYTRTDSRIMLANAFAAITC